MKWHVVLSVFVIFLIILSCNYDQGNVLENNGLVKSELDTLYSDEVLREYRKELTDYRSTLKLEYLDKNDSLIKGFYSNDTLRLRVIYYSQKFPLLNENYEIILSPVSKNFQCRKLKRNKFELFIEPKTEMIEFDLYLSCRGVVFKYASIDKEKNLYYKIQEQVGLSRFYEPVGNVR